MTASDLDDMQIGYDLAPDIKDLFIGPARLDEEDMLAVEGFGDKVVGGLDS